MGDIADLRRQLAEKEEALADFKSRVEKLMHTKSQQYEESLQQVTDELSAQFKEKLVAVRTEKDAIIADLKDQLAHQEDLHKLHLDRTPSRSEVELNATIVDLRRELAERDRHIHQLQDTPRVMARSPTSAVSELSNQLLRMREQLQEKEDEASRLTVGSRQASPNTTALATQQLMEMRAALRRREDEAEKERGRADRLQQELNRSQSEVASLVSSAASSPVKIGNTAQLERELQDCRLELAHNDELIASLRESLLAAERERDGATAQIITLRERASKQNAEATSPTEETERLELNLSLTKARHWTETEALTREVKTLKQQTQAEQDNAVALRLAKARHAQEVEDLMAQIRSLKKQKAIPSGESNETAEATKETEIALRLAKARHMQEANALQSEIRELKRQVSSPSRDAAANGVTVKHVESDLDQAGQDEVAFLKAELNSVRSLLGQQFPSAETIRKSVSTSSTVSGTTETLKKENSSQAKKIATLQSEVESLRKQLEGHKPQLATENVTTITVVGGATKEAQDDSDPIEYNYDGTRVTKDSLTALLDQSNSRVSKLTQQRSELLARISQLEAKLTNDKRYQFVMVDQADLTYDNQRMKRRIAKLEAVQNGLAFEEMADRVTALERDKERLQNLVEMQRKMRLA